MLTNFQDHENYRIFGLRIYVHWKILELIRICAANTSNNSVNNAPIKNQVPYMSYELFRKKNKNFVTNSSCKKKKKQNIVIFN